MATKVIHYEGYDVEFDYESHGTFIDHRGRTVEITSVFPYDFIMENSFIKSYLSFCNWLDKNKLLVQPSVCNTSLGYYFGNKYWDEYKRENWVQWAYGDSYKKALDFYSNTDRTTQPQSFLLVGSDEPPVGSTPVYFVDRFNGCILRLKRKSVEQVSSLTVPNTIWSKKYNYSYKMYPNDFKFFRGDSSVYFGMELEISTRLSTQELQYIVTDIEPKQEPFFIMKDDGSITGCYGNRVELVTVPCSPKYLRKNWKLFFNKLETLAKARGNTLLDYFDLNTNLNNGIHIHVNKDSFADEVHMNKFLQVWHQRDDEASRLFNKMSQRCGQFWDNQYCQHSHRYTGMSLAKRMKMAKRTRTGIDERYCVAHDRSSNTVEVRLFQGIFDLKHIFRCVSFTESIFEFTWGHGFTSFGDNFTKKYLDFINKQHKYQTVKELAQCA